jgi:lysozyme family protein
MEENKEIIAELMEIKELITKGAEEWWLAASLYRLLHYNFYHI